MTTVRDLIEELNVPAQWVIKAFMSASKMKTLSSELTDEEVAFIRSEAVRWRADPPPLTTWGVPPEVEAFERAVVELGPRPLIILGSSLSPDGRFGAALTLLPTANDYVMNDLYERTADGWRDYGGGNGDIQWQLLDEDSGRGVLTFGGEAPPDATIARISYEGRERPAWVRHGHFFFVCWDTPYEQDPVLLGFS